MPITDGYPENQRIPSMKLNQLTDVDTGVPVDGDHLVWNEAEGEWQSEQPPAEYDPNAIHDNENNELALIPYKPNPVAEDIILIEDSENENAKKVISLGQLLGQVNPGAVVDGGGCTVGDDGYTYCVYTADGTATFTSGGLVEILLVGGGGGGGAAYGDGAGGSSEEAPGGGGGGGEVKYLTAVEVAATSYAVTIGAGGAGGTETGAGPTDSSSGEAGGTTSVAGLGTAVGGGGGGAGGNTGDPGELPSSGASGGGGGFGNLGASGTSGGDGGDATTGSPFHAGGGGGAGEDGDSGAEGAAGGDGAYVDVFADWGDSGWYGGGGGGGLWGSGQNSGAGGQGGAGGTNSSSLTGSANTGGGGGGRGNGSFDFGGSGGDGGSGIVIFRIPPTGNLQIGGPQTPGEGTPLEVTDDDAVHVDTAGEFTAVASKTEVADCDTLLIEDCADGDAKKSVTVSDLVSSPAVVAALESAGLAGGELLMQDGVTNPPVPLETEAQDDWLYAD